MAFSVLTLHSLEMMPNDSVTRICFAYIKCQIMSSTETWKEDVLGLHGDSLKKSQVGTYVLGVSTDCFSRGSFLRISLSFKKLYT